MAQSDLPNGEDLENFTDACPTLTLNELNSLWPLVHDMVPHMDRTLNDVVAAYRLGREHGIVESQAQNMTPKID